MSSDDENDDVMVYGNRVAVGTQTNYSGNIIDTLNNASKNKQDFVAIPLFHPRFRTDSINVSDYRQGTITRSDMALDDEDWTSNVIGLVSDWLDLDNSNSSLRISSEIAMKREYLYASHLGLQAVICPAPHVNSANYARYMSNMIRETSPTAAQLWIRIPLQIPHNHYNDAMFSSSSSSSSAKKNEFLDGWELWDSFRHHTAHNPRIHIALELPHDLKNIPLDTIERWAAEPVKAVVISTKCFTVNKQGKPKLSTRFQYALHCLFKFNLHVILKDSPEPGIPTAKYLQYIERLCADGVDGQGQGPFTLYDKFAHPFRDGLQSPLHPLSDNLDSETYRVMEKDPVKYDQYELAVKRALIDLDKMRTKENGGSRSKSNKRKATTATTDADLTTPLTVMVVGAGRGPLVQATLNAAEETGIAVKVYAVEKNFNAVVTLRNRFSEPAVTVLFTDMRDLRSLAARLNISLCVDIIVSELLGSWGDNELSPECLDTVQDLLRPGSGVMIPQNYESFLAPLAASKLWMSAKDMFHSSDVRSGLDSPYVVNLHCCKVLAQAKPLFKFEHPNLEIGSELQHNARFRQVSFTANESVTVHGFAGYFECTLYKDVTFSTVPHTHSPGMFSWFPLFVPLRVPLRVRAGNEVCVNVWRCIGERKVWYEWGLSQPVATIVQNSNGVSYNVPL